ncbi:MAG: hypothetical protein E7211_21880 [Clostridium lundense]|jgi:Tfp pilus assembly protein PilN|nr:hypothetical protein [Clostridium lundense]
MSKLDKSVKAKDAAIIIIALILLVGFAYYSYVFEPTRSRVAAANARRDELEAQVMTTQTRVAQLQKMQDEMDSIGTNADRMESYNNSKAEIALLNNCLVDAKAYSINFTDITRNGNQIRRNFSLQFTTDSYESVRRILTNLTASEFRCLLGDMSYNNSTDRETNEQTVTVNCSATFFETMVGGEADAGLPPDIALKN